MIALHHLLESRSTRARGLKYWDKATRRIYEESRSTRARGLKSFVDDEGEELFCIALNTSAWIEMYTGLLSVILITYRAQHERVD